jgi:hypothetical protein
VFAAYVTGHSYDELHQSADEQRTKQITRVKIMRHPSSPSCDVLEHADHTGIQTLNSHHGLLSNCYCHRRKQGHWSCDWYVLQFANTYLKIMESTQLT